MHANTNNNRKLIWPKDSLKEILGCNHPEITGISFDTRTIKPGDMFIALRATRDGHDFVQEAIDKGASFALVEREICKNNIVVDSVINTIVEIAKYRRSMFKGIVIGITGSVGKTTSKQMLTKALLSAGHSVFATEKSYNNLLGLSYSLATMPLDVEFAVLELGTSGFGEIETLAQMCQLDYSLITAIAQAHIEMLGSMKNIVFEKREIIKYTKKGTVFDCNAWYSHMLIEIAKENGVEYRCFESNENAMETMQRAWVVLLEMLGINGYQFDEKLLNNITGRRNVFEAVLNGQKVRVIDSAYNANLGSMIESLKFLSTFDGPKTAILGDMLAIGTRGPRYHEMLAPYLKDMNLLCVGENMRLLAEKLATNGMLVKWFESTSCLIEYLRAKKLDGTLLIKGSSDAHKSPNDLDCVVKFFESNKVG